MTVTNIADVVKRAELFRALSRAGWRVAEGATSVAAAKIGGPTIYVTDVATGTLYVVGLTTDAISVLTKQAAEGKVSFRDICDSLGSLIGDLAANKTVLEAETRAMLSAAAALYMAGTKSYELLLSMRPDNHYFMIIRYIDRSTGEPLLRPTPLLATAPLSPSDVAFAVDQVLAIDRQMHPERFGTAKLLPFRPIKTERV